MEYNPYSRQWEAVLFLLDAPATKGCIGSYVGAHSEASLDYYRTNTRLPKVMDEKKACEALVAEYRLLPPSGDGSVDVVTRCRITGADLRAIWAGEARCGSAVE
jgi:hypothetical protein